MLIVPTAMLLRAGGGARLPVATLTAVSLDLTQYGYAAPGGYNDQYGNGTGGSLSKTLYPDLVTTDVLLNNISSGVLVAFSGDVVSAISNITGIMVNGVSYDHEENYYDDSVGITTAAFDGPSNPSPGSYTVQLVGE